MLETRKRVLAETRPSGLSALHGIEMFRPRAFEFVAEGTRLELGARLDALADDIAACIDCNLDHRPRYWAKQDSSGGGLADVPLVFLREFWFTLAAFQNVLANQSYFLDQARDKDCCGVFVMLTLDIDRQFQWFQRETHVRATFPLFGPLDDLD